jgi:hypothetical protein
MNAANTSTFRGYRAISDVVERMRPLADWLELNAPTCHVMTLARRDLDLLQRWPEAAAVHQIHTNHDRVTYWRGFELRADKTASRYEKAR